MRVSAHTGKQPSHAIIHTPLADASKADQVRLSMYKSSYFYARGASQRDWKRAFLKKRTSQMDSCAVRKAVELQLK